MTARQRNIRRKKRDNSWKVKLYKKQNIGAANA